MKPVRHKFNAVRTKRGDRSYDSKAEAAYADMLSVRKLAGTVLFWLEHVPIALPGGVKYVVDFVVFDTDGAVHFVDVKGVVTPMFTLKKKQVEALYPFEIEVVGKQAPKRARR
jgi:hypothetical protein